MIPRLRWLIPLAALPFLGLLVYAFRTDPRAIPSPLVGRPAPRFTISAFDGTTVSLGALRGRVVVLNFWASWCVPACYDEAPVLESAWQAYRERGLAVVGIAIQDSAENSQEFIRRFRLSFSNGPDPGGRVSIDYGVYGVPETFVIDREGRIRAKHVGAVTDAVLRQAVEPLLAQAAG